MMKNRVYADGVENVSLLEGMVRLDLFNYEGGDVATRELTTQVILPPAAFLRAFESMQRFVHELERKGVVSRAPEKTPKPQEPVSPNFS